MSNDDVPPIIDAADQVAAFMGMPLIIRRAVIRAVYAGRDLPTEQLDELDAAMGAAAQVLPLSPEARHFIKMCASVPRAVASAKRTGWVG